MAGSICDARIRRGLKCAFDFFAKMASKHNGLNCRCLKHSWSYSNNTVNNIVGRSLHLCPSVSCSILCAHKTPGVHTLLQKKPKPCESWVPEVSIGDSFFDGLTKFRRGGPLKTCRNPISMCKRGICSPGLNFLSVPSRFF